MVTATAPDRGGRSPDLRRRIRRLARTEGEAWLNELSRQARLGDTTALAFLLGVAVSAEKLPAKFPLDTPKKGTG